MRNIPKEIRPLMLSDDWRVRLSVVDAPSVTTGALIKLSHDTVKAVSEAASKRIGFLKPKK